VAADSAAVEALTCLAAQDLSVKDKTFCPKNKSGGIAADTSYTSLRFNLFVDISRHQ